MQYLILITLHKIYFCYKAFEIILVEKFALQKDEFEVENLYHGVLAWVMPVWVCGFLPLKKFFFSRMQNDLFQKIAEERHSSWKYALV